MLRGEGVAASRAVAAYLETATIPEHEFTRLYECRGCGWWAIWESWGDREYFGQDFTSVIVSVGEGTQAGWKEALQDADAYEHEQPLPESLGQIFVGGKKKKPALLQPGDRVRIVEDVVVHHPTRALSMNFLITQGTQGVIVELSAYEAQMQRLQPKDTSHYSFQEGGRRLVDMSWAEMEIREGRCYAVRLGKIEPVSRSRPAPAERTGGLDLGKEGMIYLVYVSDVEGRTTEDRGPGTGFVSR
jgi:hypothetical protein